jgi:hypothetical protein
MNVKNNKYVEKYPECPLVDIVLTPDTNFTNNVTFGLKALGAVEHDFQCAGFCRNSTFFSFSNVTLGQPTQHCHEGITTYVEDKRTQFAAFFWPASAAMLGAAIYITCMVMKKKHRLTEPLLGHK